MYLISIYFDEKTNKRIGGYMKQVAEKTGNMFMPDNRIPPHITVAAVEARDEMAVIKAVEGCVPKLRKGNLRWVSVGAFLPQVIYIEPVLNEYLHGMAVTLNEALKGLPDTKVSRYYQPFGWLPHTTIGKQLTKEQMETAFGVLQNQFSPFEGTVISIGIAKPNPHRDLALWKLPD